MPEIPKAYEPQLVESKWYQYWLDNKFFVANPASPKPPYSIVIPPPNVTGVLTLGHVLNNTIQDILARKARMEGQEVLWLPGTDHAGIATEGMVVRQLRKEEKKTKHDIGREEFLKRVWAWKEKHGGIIIEQLKKLGCSCDWSRERFTMDEHYVRCVQKVFVELYKKGLIYRGKRMVNWCPASLTALSDEEVIMKPQSGVLYYFKVEVSGPLTPSLSPGGAEGGQEPMWLTIATTRPETIPGDTAVAVNPKDPRYAHLIGKHVVRPLPPELPREQKLIPIIGDEHVDFEFGTGVLKVTPAHDKADFDIGQRHKLAVVDIMNPDATMNDLAGTDLRGLDRFKARKVAVEKLTELGALEKEEPYTNNVGFSERADVPIEPRLSEQWFLKYPSVQKARACVAQEGSATVPVADSGVPPESSRAQSAIASSGAVARNSVGGTPTGAGETPALPEDKMHFYPQRWAKVYDHWMAGIQDWCISRQLWWGHRIPVWTKSGEMSLRDAYGYLLTAVLEADNYDNGAASEISIRIDGSPVAADTKEFQAKVESEDPGLDVRGFHQVMICSAREKISACLENFGWTQDPDVLDTWFSSWLWPFATMGWPAQTDMLKKFYPTTDLVTGPDIIFFWVARMIMAGYEFMGEMPFRNVYFTGIIRDKLGRKMSKSLGNSPDPLDLITKYGADALRFGVMRAAPLGQDILFDEQNVELGRNFCNKLWNACRFRQMQGGEVQGEINSSLLRSDDKWILIKLGQAIRELTAALAEYKFSEATQTLYRFFWSEYCDWYIEASKAVLSRPPSEASPSALGGERAGVRGEDDDSNAATTPPLPGPLPPAPPGGEGDAHRANKLAVIDFVLSHTLRLFHPFLPFITEELWHAMGYHQDMPVEQGGESIQFAPWPKPFDSDFRDFYSLDDCYLESVNAKYETVTRGRNLRREANIPSNKKVRFVLKPIKELPANDVEVLKVLLNAETFETNPDYQPAKGTPAVHTDLGELHLPLEGLVDFGAEIARLAKEVEKIRAEIVKVEEKLNNPAFVQKVPPQVLAEHQRRLADWQAKLSHVQKTLSDLSSS